MTPSRPSAPAIGSRGVHRFSIPALIAMTAVAVMAALALTVLLLQPFSSGPIGGTPSSTASPTAEPSPTPAVTPRQTPEPTAVPTPTPIPEWTGLTWSDPVTPSFVIHLFDVVPWGDGYVAVGEVPGQGPWASFTSPDGLHWTIEQRDFPGAPRHLVALGDELFAFMPEVWPDNSSPPGSAIGGPPTSIIWRSTDGATWAPVDSPSWQDAWHDAIPGMASLPDGWDETQYDIAIGLVDVVSGPDGLVAIGNSYGEYVWDDVDQITTADELDPVLVHSTDGSTWTDVSQSAQMPSALLESVAAYQGGYVVVGAVNAGPRTETATPAAWVSADGRSWTGTAVDLAPTAGGEFGRVVAGADGLLAWAGPREMHTGPRFTSVWTSPDGLTWSPGDLPTGVTGLVAADGTRIVALGPMPSLATDPALWPGISEGWVSTDGQNWTSLEMPTVLDDFVEAMWVVPDGIIYAGVQSFWFASAIER
jgi:hypothetical protein